MIKFLLKTILISLFIHGISIGFAKENLTHDKAHIIKVGFYSYTGFFEKKDNDTTQENIIHQYSANDISPYYGYGVDLLNTLARIQGFKYEFVEGEWENLLEDLKEKKIDLLMPAYKTELREKSYTFSATPFGLNMGVVLAAANNNKIFFDDISHMQNLKVGMVTNQITLKAYQKYLDKNNLTQQIIVYKNEEILYQSLLKNKVDLMIGDIASLQDKIKPIAYFSIPPFYFMSYKNSEIIKVIDAALFKIKKQHFDLEEHLFSRWYGSKSVFTKIALTRKESLYKQNNPQVNIILPSNCPPLVFKADGKLQGIMLDILHEIEHIAKIKFKIKLSENYDIAAALREGDAQLAAFSTYIKDRKDANSVSDFAEFSQTATLLQGNLNILVHANTNIYTSNRITLAIPYMPFHVSNYSIFHHRFKYCKLDECLQLLLDKKVSALLIDEYQGAYIKQQPLYKDLKIIPNSNANIYFNFLAKANSSSELKSIIKKSLKLLDRQKIKQIVLHYTINHSYTLSISDLWLKYKVEFTLAALIISIVLLILLVIILYQRVKVKYLQQEAIQHKKIQDLTRKIYIDELTCLYNRKFINEVLEPRIKSHDLSVGIIFIDVDNFKVVNDKLGHKFGDKVLQEIATTICDNLRKENYAIRLGGDEFIIVVETTKMELVQKIASRIKLAIQDTLDIYNKKGYSITISMGLSLGKGDFFELCHQADILMYKGKRSGKNKIVT